MAALQWIQESESQLEKKSNSVQMTATEIAQRLEAKRGGAGWQARCPSHNDETPSLSIREGADGRVLIRCFAGCSLQDICAALNIKIRDLFNDNNMTPGEFRREVSVAVKDSEPEPKPEPPPPGKIDKLNAAGIVKLAAWRGLSHEFVEKLNDTGILGTFTDKGERHIAFPVPGGVHYRLQDGSWRFSQGASPDLFVLGEIEEGAHVHVFESQWCALTYADASGELNNVIATRGAGNAKLVAQRLTGHTGTLYLWPQNDRPGQKWAQDIRELLPNEQIKLCIVPHDFRSGGLNHGEHKDLNSWRKAGATDGAIWQAFIDAKDYELQQTSNRNDASPEKGQAETKTIPSVGVQALRERTEGISNQQPVRPEVSSKMEGEDGGAQGQNPEAGQVREVREPNQTGSASPRLQQAAGSNVAVPNVPLADTLDKIVEFLNRYVVFPLEEQAVAITLWIAHAHTFLAFRFTPYLHVCSPEKRCGKTRLLECIELLVPRPRSMVRPSEPVLFRTIEREKPTLLLDEVDTIFGKDADNPSSEGLRAVLNAGFQSGAKVPRCVGNTFELAEFSVFCPKVIAGIGKIPDTVLDRSIEIRLVRQTNETKATRFRLADAQKEAAPMRAALEAWSRNASGSLSSARPHIPEQLTDRQQDMFEPLLAIAEMAGAEWAELGRNALIAMAAMHEDQSLGVQLLASIRETFAFANTDRMPTTELIERLIGQESADAPWPTLWENDFKRGNTKAPARRMAQILEPFGVKPGTIRPADGGTPKGYYRRDFEDAWKRYLDPVRGMATMTLGI